MGTHEQVDYPKLEERVHNLARRGFFMGRHALNRIHERDVLRTEVRQVLLYGKIDPSRTRYDPKYNTISYAIEAQTCDRLLLRVVFVFDKNDKVRVITVVDPVKR